MLISKKSIDDFIVSVSPRGRARTPETTRMRRRMHSLERTAQKWQAKAQQLQAEKELLKAHSSHAQQVPVAI